MVQHPKRRRQQFVVRTAALDIKKQALVAINGMAAYCGQDYMPYLEKTCEALKQQTDISEEVYWHPDVVCEAVRTLPALAICSANYRFDEVLLSRGPFARLMTD